MPLSTPQWWAGLLRFRCGVGSSRSIPVEGIRHLSALASAPSTCAVLLQAPDLRVQPLQSAGVFSLEEQQVLLGALELVLQVGGCHPDMQFRWQKQTQNSGYGAQILVLRGSAARIIS